MKKATTMIMILLLVFLGGCIPAQVVSLLQPANPTATPSPEPAATQQIQTAPTLVVDSSVLSLVQQTFQQIYQDVNPSVVNIQITQNIGYSTVSGEGSGFVWDKEGHIVTNNHVVNGASQILVIFSDGKSVEARLVGKDPESDLAVIQVDASAVTLHPVIMGDSHTVKVGDLVIAIGNPYGLAGTMTQGIVSALSRSLTVDSSSMFSSSTYTIPDIIQTDAAINPGNSGGVLVNVSGEVIGVTSAIQSSTNSNAGIGFVIPSHIVQRVVPVLISNGSYAHPNLGLTGVTLTPTIANEVGLDPSLQGVLVVNVTPNGAADRAGLLGSSQQMARPGQLIIVGGDVITAVDGQPVKTYEDLISYLFNKTEVGQQITLTLLRSGKEKIVKVTLGSNS